MYIDSQAFAAMQYVLYARSPRQFHHQYWSSYMYVLLINVL